MFSGVLSKDLFLVVVSFFLLGLLFVCLPNYFIDAENWINNNPIVTPEHIKPE
jgi:quinol-cytochrome oxidoreductase complex cytochrome b subunit